MVQTNQEMIRNEMSKMQRRRKDKKWIWLAVERASQKIREFYVDSREASSFEKLSQNIQRLNVKTYATDAWESYNLIDPKKHIVGKAHSTNRLLRHYLARFARKAYYVSKSLNMIFYSLYLFSFRHLLPSIYF